MAEHHPAKKAAKKAAKKVAGKPDPHKATKDMRRSFEHHGRVRILAERVGEEHALSSLLQFADGAFKAGQYKASAELLRTAEHLSFGTLQTGDADTVSPELQMELEHEIEHILDRAKEHGEAEESPKAIQVLYQDISKKSQDARERGTFRSALELARAAEALTHVGALEGWKLPPGENRNCWRTEAGPRMRLHQLPHLWPLHKVAWRRRENNRAHPSRTI